MSRKIATLWDSKPSDESEDQHGHDDREHGQAFYAGGSEHSGQQILGGGPSQDRLIENLFNHARQSAALVQDQSSSSGGGNNPGATSLPITFWRNGFTVGTEGELRQYEDARNRQFLECLKRGETPPELASRVRGGMIDVKLENKAQQDYKAEKIVAFSGKGYRLGAPSPET